VIGDLIAGRYEVEELIGTGGMSSVFRAHDRLLDRRVALKILHERHAADADYVERFRREARSVAQLSHPNIVTVIDRGESEGRQYIVLEYVEGENLKQLVARGGPLPIRRALELAIQTGRALAFAHASGLVHRDVKPQNVLLGNGTAKVTDFGIARTLDVHGLTQTGTVLGTSDYIAPEQATGQRAGERSDVYSLAVVLFELLTGEVPFAGDNFVQVALRHVGEPAPSVLERRPEVPLRVAAAIARGMEKEPADRFGSMSELVGELGACLAELGEPDSDPTLIVKPRTAPAPRRRQQSPPRRRLRRRVLGPVALLALLGAAAAAVLILGQRGSAPSGSGGPGGGGSSAVHLRAPASYDPSPGDGREHDELLARATDGDAATFWETERYGSQDFGGLKHGVGIVLDAGRAVRLPRLTVRTDTPGFTAVVKAGSAIDGPFSVVSPTQTVADPTTFALRVPAPTRYYLLWITRLAPNVERTHVDEVTAS
jgi:eukaryotic-like serine/threonine-protein kinase